MPADWDRVLAQIRRDRHSGASILLGRAIEAARLFLAAARDLPPSRLAAALERFTVPLVEAQPAMAAFLRLANTLWLGPGRGADTTPAWADLHRALVRSAGEMEANLQATVRRAARLIRSRSLVLTYSNSTAVRMALWRAMAGGRRFEVVCSESRPMREGVALGRQLAACGIPVHLVVDAALAEWVSRADVVLLGADAILPAFVVNKVGSEAILQAARRARIAAYVLADSSKWLPDGLSGFWRAREEAPDEIVRPRAPNLLVHNCYFGMAPLRLVTGVVWEGGVARPSEARRRIARLPVSGALVRLLEAARPAKQLIHAGAPAGRRRSSKSPRPPL